MACLCLLLCHGVGAAGSRQQALRKKLEGQLHLLELHGFSGAVLIEGRNGLELVRGFGFSDRESGTRTTPTTLFAIASLTKHFTGAAILLLDQQGRLSLEDTVGKYFPDRLRAFSGVTIDQLLRHRSGLPDNCGRQPPASQEEFLSCLEEIRSPSPPGQFEYSNAGYALLAALIERVSAQPYTEYLRSHLLEPAGMHDSGFLDEADRWPAGRVATQYTWARDFGTEIRQQIDWNFRGAADLVSSVEEMARWRKHLFNGFLDTAHLAQLFGLALDVQGVGNWASWCVDGAMTLGYSSRWCAGDAGQILVLGNQVFGLVSAAPPMLALLQGFLTGEPPLLRWKPELDAIPDLSSWQGRYRWDEKSELEIEVEAPRLRVSGRGQPAVNWLVSAHPGQSQELEQVGRRSADMMASLQDHDYAAAAAKSGDPGAAAALEAWLGGLEARHGPLEDAEVIGTIPQGPSNRSYVQLRFEKGTELRRLRWTANQMTSMLTASLPLAPVYFVPVGKNRLIGYHLAFPGRGPIGLKLLRGRGQIQVKDGERWRTLEKLPRR